MLPEFLICCCCLQMRIDHKNGTVHFGKLQLESDRLRDNIQVLAQRLAMALTIVNPAPSAGKAEAKKKVLSPTSPRANFCCCDCMPVYASMACLVASRPVVTCGQQACCDLAPGLPLA